MSFFQNGNNHFILAILSSSKARLFGIKARKISSFDLRSLMSLKQSWIKRSPQSLSLERYWSNDLSSLPSLSQEHFMNAFPHFDCSECQQNILIAEENSMQRLREMGCLHLKSDDEQKIQNIEGFFDGIPSTMENVNFSFNCSFSPQVLLEKTASTQMLKKTRQQVTSLDLQPQVSQNAKEKGSENSLTWLETLKKLKKQREQLMQKRTKKPALTKFSSPIVECKTSVGNQRISNICKNVANKLKRNNIYSIPINQDDFSKFNRQIKHNGIVIGQYIHNIIEIYGCIVILLILFSQTFALVYQELESSSFVFITRTFGLVFYCIETTLNFMLTRKKDGKKITKIQDIIIEYLTSYFIIDISSIVILSIALLTLEKSLGAVILFLALLKLPFVMQKFSKFQRMMLSSFYYQRYWSLLKIILFNFVFAHFIAILLNLMTLNKDSNWQVVKGINHSPWSQRYTWSYYWATTIMLTVGFGDMVPTTSDEAMWLIFIEIVSCVAFSYNISCLGSIIGNIRAQGQEIDKNRKIFENMSKNNGISQTLVQKVESYIDQSVKLRNKFNIEEEKIFIDNLPPGFREEVVCESNKNMLMKLNFFGSLLQKSIYRLSEKIQRQMYHPQEVIRVYSSKFKVLILRQGEIGYNCRNKPNWHPVNTISISKKNHPFLVTMECITRKQPNYEVRSLDYSIVHQLSEEALIEALRNISKDYQYYSFLKDKSKHIVDEFETVPCELCETKHTKCDCPKYHFIPIKQHTIQKFLAHVKIAKDIRKIYNYRDRISFNSLKVMKSCNQSFELRNQMVQPKSNNHQKNQIMFINTIAKKAFNESDATKPINNKSGKLEGEKFLKMANLMIKQAISYEFKMKDHDDQVWELASDMVWNYDMYFPQDNSSNLEKLYDIEERMARLDGCQIIKSRKR